MAESMTSRSPAQRRLSAIFAFWMAIALVSAVIINPGNYAVVSRLRMPVKRGIRDAGSSACEGKTSCRSFGTPTGKIP
jgi:hypothetical protein